MQPACLLRARVFLQWNLLLIPKGGPILRKTQRGWRTCVASNHKPSLCRLSCFPHLYHIVLSVAFRLLQAYALISTNPSGREHRCTATVLERTLGNALQEAYPRQRNNMQTCKTGPCPDRCQQEVHSLHFHWQAHSFTFGTLGGGSCISRACLCFGLSCPWSCFTKENIKEDERVKTTKGY